MALERSPSQKSFIGRERELAELDAGLSDTLSGRGRLFLLSGEPGIGKSRLADEFSARTAARGAAVVWGRCWDGAGAPAYWPVIQRGPDIASNAPDLPQTLQAQSHLCLLYFDMNRRDDAHRSLEHCRAIFAAGEDWKGIRGLAARAEAVVAAFDRKFEEADAQFEKAVDNLRHYRLVWLEADAYYDWGRVLISAGEECRANEKFGAAIEVYRRIGANIAGVTGKGEAPAMSKKARTPFSGASSDARGPPSSRDERSRPAETQTA